MIKKIMGLVTGILMLTCMGFAAGIELENGGKVTPMIDAIAYYEWLYHGTMAYETAHPQVFAEVGARYDKSTPTVDYFSSITMFHEDQIHDESKDVQLGDLNIGFSKGHHTFTAGRGKYPVGVILANHNVNQRKEIWAPTDLSMFLIDVVGDRCNAIFYQYENSVKDLNYKLKFIGTKNRYYPTIAYGETGSMTAIPIYSIELNYKKVTVESTYSNYRNGDVITYMNGVQFDLPNNYRLEIQQTNHRRRANVGFSSAGTVDDHLLLAMFGEPAQAYIISQHYADVEVILEKESTLNGHRIVYFGQYVAANMGGDLAFATKTHGLIVAQPGSHLMDWVTAWQYRLGASYWLTDELSFAGEWEHNHIISVLPNWQDRIAVGLRVKI